MNPLWLEGAPNNQLQRTGPLRGPPLDRSVI
jgi:hypothetical protein